MPADYRKHVDAFLATFGQPSYLFVLERDLSAKLPNSMSWVLDAPAATRLRLRRKVTRHVIRCFGVVTDADKQE